MKTEVQSTGLTGITIYETKCYAKSVFTCTLDVYGTRFAEFAKSEPLVRSFRYLQRSQC